MIRRGKKCHENLNDSILRRRQVRAVIKTTAQREEAHAVPTGPATGVGALAAGAPAVATLAPPAHQPKIL